MIPKIIHYSWISGDPYPEKIQRCIDSWREKLPDYQFINWNRDTFDMQKMQSAPRESLIRFPIRIPL